MGIIGVLITTFVFSALLTALIMTIVGFCADDKTTAGMSLGSLIVFILIFLITFILIKPWSFVDNYELGYIYDSSTGKINIIGHTGYVSRTPFFQTVHTIDLRPRQVCINAGDSDTSGVNNRVLNCKLVSFNPDPKALALFLSWHGRGNYDGETLNNLLKIYAYDPSGRHYPFLNVSSETQSMGSSQADPAFSQPVGAKP